MFNTIYNFIQIIIFEIESGEYCVRLHIHFKVLEVLDLSILEHMWQLKFFIWFSFFKYSLNWYLLGKFTRVVFSDAS